MPQPSDRPITVAVDAGHGGGDPGAIGHAGTREKLKAQFQAHSIERAYRADVDNEALRFYVNRAEPESALDLISPGQEMT